MLVEAVPGLRVPATLERAFEESRPSVGLFRRMAAIAGVLALLAVVAAIVYSTGGTHTAYLHLAYLPILFAASVFGVIGGLAAALVAGLGVAGPLMPLDTATGATQPATSWLFRSGFFLLFGIVAGFTIGRLRQQLDRIRSASFRHPNTGLPTQAALELLIGEILESRQRNHGYGVITVEVKNYDHIFNTLGSGIVPYILAAAAERLRPLFPLPCQIFHIHSGKMAVLVSEATEPTLDQARRALDRLVDPVKVDSVPVYLDVVGGVALFDHGDTDVSMVLQKSNIALAEAHRKGLAFTQYDQVHHPDKKDTIQLLAEAPKAIKDEQFQLMFQPQIRLADGQVIGSEALIRWQHPERGLLAPGRFIPVLEDTALINSLTRWVARASIRQAAEWQEAGLNMTVAFNVSPRNIENPQLFATILEEIQGVGLDPRWIELEITESAIINDAKAVAYNLHELKEAGVSIALDDFGNGYTSVRHLTALPIDKLKIDRSLIDRVNTDVRRMRIVSAIIHLARDLGLRTVAEGVEDAETEHYLRQEGCEMAQGFHYSKPLMPGTLARHLRDGVGLALQGKCAQR